ncbi:MAG: GldM family protein [Chitinophagales bacterium]
MAGGKLTPRQKMINMMYLVLTALLAMNVSSEVLEAFRLVEVGIENSNGVLEDKIKSVDEALVTMASDSKTSAEAQPLLAKSKEISGITNDLISFLNELKATLLLPENSGENPERPGEPEKLDDIDSGTRLLSDPEAAPSKFKGQELQDKINATKSTLMAALKDVKGVTDADLTSLEAGLTLRAEDSTDPEKDIKNWYYQFHHVPTPGTMTILTKIENDALSAEASINEFLLNRIGKLDFKFDKLRATVQAEKAYLPGGAQYEANIFLTASSNGMIAETYVGSLDWDKFEKDSVGDFLPFNSATETPFKSEPKKLPANGKLTRGTSVGQNAYAGAIKIENPAGGFDWYPFKSSYEGAAAGGFSASPTKMNVLYIGVDNPMSITVGDAKPGSERASLSGGSISKSGNGWVAKVSKQGEATLTASGTTPDGNPTKSFSAKFRVKRIPDPVPTLGGKLQGGNIQKGTLAAQTGIIALLKDFDFDARFTVASYDFTLVSKGEVLPARGNSGPTLGSQVKNLLNRARPKDIAIFQKIKVRGPDGTTRTLPSLTFNII